MSNEFPDGPEVHSGKKFLRKRLIGIRDAIPAEKRIADASEIRRLARTFFGMHSGKIRAVPARLTVQIFLPFGSEPDTEPLLHELFKAGHRPLLPSLSPPEGLILREWRPGLLLRSGPFGIREPADGLPVDPGDVDLFFVPGVGFDPLGHRLGYGKGYFDRLLSKSSVRGLKVGLAFSAQVLSTIPATPHDVPMDFLLTEKGVCSCD